MSLFEQDHDLRSQRLPPLAEPLLMVPPNESMPCNLDDLNEEYDTETVYHSPLSCISGRSEEDYSQFHAQEDEEELSLPADDGSTFYGLPACCLTITQEGRGIRTLYSWQTELLSNPAILNGRNLLYSLPTSGGKSLVAEILSLRTVYLRKQLVLYIVPYVSLVGEKRKAFQLFSEALEFPVDGYFGCRGKLPLGPAPRIIVATIEKANIIINNLIETERIEELGLVVVDELHMVGSESGHRGLFLETLLSKIRFCTPSTQIVSMSATIPNLGTLADWLGATSYESSFRPVPLHEYVKLGDTIFDKQFQVVRKMKPVPNDEDNLGTLCCEVAPAKSLLIFCSTKHHCQSCANRLCDLLPKETFLMAKRQEKLQLIEEMRASHITLDDQTVKCLEMGIAYHHSGLTTEERDFIEQSFRDKVLCILCCTSTLAAGVNLPAKRVIFRTPYVGKQFLLRSQYMQMAGRAGRAGLDECGESILLITKKERKSAEDLLRKPLDPLHSSIDDDGVHRVVLELVGSGLCKTVEDLSRLADCTLWATEVYRSGQCTRDDLHNNIVHARFSAALSHIIEHRFALKVTVSPPPPPPDLSSSSTSSNGNTLPDSTTPQSVLQTTPLGAATFRSSFSLEEACLVGDELNRAREYGLISADSLHICYLITPISDQIPVNWEILNNITQKMTLLRRRILSSIGVSPEFIHESFANATGYDRRRQGDDKTAREINVNEMKATRLFNALILCDVIQQKNVFNVASRFGVPRGAVQRLATSAAMFASMMVRFCRCLGWWCLDSAIDAYSHRLEIGAELKKGKRDPTSKQGQNSTEGEKTARKSTRGRGYSKRRKFSAK